MTFRFHSKQKHFYITKKFIRMFRKLWLYYVYLCLHLRDIKYQISICIRRWYKCALIPAVCICRDPNRRERPQEALCKSTPNVTYRHKHCQRQTHTCRYVSSTTLGKCTEANIVKVHTCRFVSSTTLQKMYRDKQC